jgi:hypothetical protein
MPPLPTPVPRLAIDIHTQEAPRKRPTLETRRAVVLEKPEAAAAALLAQLNAIRNAKAEKRRAASARRRGVAAAKAAKEAEWRDRCAWMCICVCMCVCVYTDADGEGWAGRQAGYCGDCTHLILHQ